VYVGQNKGYFFSPYAPSAHEFLFKMFVEHLEGSLLDWQVCVCVNGGEGGGGGGGLPGPPSGLGSGGGAFPRGEPAGLIACASFGAGEGEAVPSSLGEVPGQVENRRHGGACDRDGHATVWGSRRGGWETAATGRVRTSRGRLCRSCRRAWCRRLPGSRWRGSGG